jgi:hypothetical protein
MEQSLTPDQIAEYADNLGRALGFRSWEPYTLETIVKLACRRLDKSCAPERQKLAWELLLVLYRASDGSFLDAHIKARTEFVFQQVDEFLKRK